MKEHLLKLEECFPGHIKMILRDHLYSEECQEIHLSRKGVIFVKLDRGIKIIDHRLSQEDFDHILKNLCRGSMYAHTESIKRGFISFMDSIRVGVSGKCVALGDKISSVYAIDTMNIRIPRYPIGVSAPVVQVMEHFYFKRGILIYSPPSVGKTTVLRDASRILSSFPHYKRVCLMDSRGELDIMDNEDFPTLDVYKFYPASKGIECAVRTMSPEIIICDEIGNEDERDALLYAAGRGVTVMASVHSSSFEEVFLIEDIKLLHKKRVFGVYIGLERRGGEAVRFKYNTWEDVEKSGFME